MKRLRCPFCCRTAKHTEFIEVDPLSRNTCDYKIMRQRDRECEKRKAIKKCQKTREKNLLDVEHRATFCKRACERRPGGGSDCKSRERKTALRSQKNFFNKSVGEDRNQSDMKRQKDDHLRRASSYSFSDTVSRDMLKKNAGKRRYGSVACTGRECRARCRSTPAGSTPDSSIQ